MTDRQVGLARADLQQRLQEVRRHLRAHLDEQFANTIESLIQLLTRAPGTSHQ